MPAPANERDVWQPGRIIRIQSMIHELLEELRGLPLDQASRAHLAGIHDESVRQLAEVVPPEVGNELRRFVTMFDGTTAPSLAELRVADAQLAGWLDGLVQGLEAGIVLHALAAATRPAEGAPKGEHPDTTPGAPYL